MSTGVNENNCAIGRRLRDERERLKESQGSLAKALMTSMRTINSYERGETSPRAIELLELSRMGADVLYIVTGARLPVGAAEARANYTPAEKLAEFITELKLSVEDTELLKAMAERLSR